MKKELVDNAQNELFKLSKTKVWDVHEMQDSPLKLRLLRLQEAGMSLVEIMIVVIIMALIATAVGVAVLPQVKKARVKSTRTDAQAIRGAVALWMGDNPGKCPALKNLLDDGVLDKSKRTADAWDHDFLIQCEGEDVTVVSSGPDGQMGTEDDIR